MKVCIAEDLTKDVLKSKIIEDSDEMNDDSVYDLLDSKSETDKEEMALDQEMDINERNFNLVKNSNSFKPISLGNMKSQKVKQ